MKFTAEQIASFIGGKIVGDSNASVSSVAKIEEGKEGDLCFLANPAYTHFIYSTRASVIIVNNDFVPEKEINSTIIKVENAYSSFATILELYNKIKNDKKGIEPMSYVSPTAKLGNDVYIGAFAYIGENVTIENNVKIFPQSYVGDNCIIGNDTILFSGVKVYADCKIGSQCRIHSGAIIGGDGFGFAPQTDGNYMKVPQTGNVIIEERVEIGSGTTIDRATLGSTIIRKGAKIDNLIQIAHNVEIGENTVIAAQTGIAGSTKIGKNCMIGGQVGIVGHITIADNVKIAAQSGVGNSIAVNGEVVQGSPSFSIGDYKRSFILFKKLPQLNNKIQELEKLILEQNSKI